MYTPEQKRGFMAERPIGNGCPYCQALMAVTRMTCGHCRVSIEAEFPPVRLGNLPIEHQRFIEMFVLASGSLKQIAEQTGVSYPTVRSRLDKVIEALRAQIARSGNVKGTIPDAVMDETMSAEQKAKFIKSI
jgi:hypothetical protein